VTTLSRTALIVGSLCILSWLAAANAAIGQELVELPPAAAGNIHAPVPPGDHIRLAANGELSDAERIARLEREIATDEKRVRELRETLHSPQGEYAKAEEAFSALDEEREAAKQKLADTEESGSAEAWARAQNDSKALEKKWELAKERFDLAIAERKAGQEMLLTLERKLEGSRETLAKLRGLPEPAKLAQPKPLAHAAPTVHAQEPVAPSPAPPAEHAEAAKPEPASPLSALPGAAIGTKLAQELAAKNARNKRLQAELEAARAAAQQSREVAHAAEAEATALGDRIALLQAEIDQQRELRGTFRKRVDNADETLKNLNAELFRKLMKGEPIDEVKQQLVEATDRIVEARDKSRDVSTHLDELQSLLAELQAEQLRLTGEVAKKRQAAEQAQAAVEKLNNPFTIRNILQWLLDHGPRIVVMLIALSTLMWLTRIFETRLVDLIARRGRRGSKEDRENRAKTLLGVFHNVANLVIVGGGLVMILDEVGIPITPVIGGAAVVGLAVAFGAQSLIKDYFTGFMVLLEQQYLINDVVKVGDITGQVERISLRMTVLRDIEGRVHFIPHGQINTVTNLTHGWSRAVFEIGVAYRENVDRAIGVLKALASGMRQDETYRLLILDEPVMLGVDSFAQSAVVIKFYIQTRPLQQWTVKRELLRRIKNEFDRLGIEIPFPHMTLYRGTGRPALGAPEESDERWNRRDVA